MRIYLDKIQQGVEMEGKYVYFPSLYCEEWPPCDRSPGKLIAGLCTLVYYDCGIEVLNIVHGGTYTTVPAYQVDYEVPVSIQRSVEV